MVKYTDMSSTVTCNIYMYVTHSSTPVEYVPEISLRCTH